MLAESIDVAPSLLSLAGFALPPSMTGKALFPGGGKVCGSGPDYVVSESPKQKRFAVINSALQWIGPAPKIELHDYVFDPLGKKNLADVLDYEPRVMRQFGIDTIRRVRRPWVSDG
jgi:hypothetical protein